MNNTETLETLRTRYFELSKDFLLALQNNRPSSELESIRAEIRNIVARLELLESPASGATE